jgi:hypothetical protein
MLTGCLCAWRPLSGGRKGVAESLDGGQVLCQMADTITNSISAILLFRKL